MLAGSRASPGDGNAPPLAAVPRHLGVVTFLGGLLFYPLRALCPSVRFRPIADIGCLSHGTRMRILSPRPACVLLVCCIVTNTASSYGQKPQKAPATPMNILNGFATLTVDNIISIERIPRGEAIRGHINGPEGRELNCLFSITTKRADGPAAAAAYYQRVIQAREPRPLGTPLLVLSYTSFENSTDPLILSRVEEWKYVGGGGYVIRRRTTSVALRKHQVVNFTKDCSGDIVYRADAPPDQVTAHFDFRWSRAALNVDRKILSPLR